MTVTPDLPGGDPESVPSSDPDPRGPIEVPAPGPGQDPGVVPATPERTAADR